MNPIILICSGCGWSGEFQRSKRRCPACGDPKLAKPRSGNFGEMRKRKALDKFIKMPIVKRWKNGDSELCRFDFPEPPVWERISPSKGMIYEMFEGVGA